VTDYVGNVYQTVLIGNQCWMMENLKVTHYRNGTFITNVIDNAEWQNLSTGAYCSYNNDPTNVAVYGLLYNWYAVDNTHNIAPVGWHVPTDDEWQDLIDYLGGYEIAGGKMKETGTMHWQSPNTGATNASGFTALPGGYRSESGGFYEMGNFAQFWSFTEAFGYAGPYARLRALVNYSAIVYPWTFEKQQGNSVRCVRVLEYTCGDANSDGSLNVSDAVFIVTHVFLGTDPPDPNCCADCPPTVTDYDGNVYQTVQIGDQCWMMENLKVTHYRNGDPIPNVYDNLTWHNYSQGAYCEYGDVNVYGRLYNWFAVDDNRIIAPEGWHVPTDEEWKQLEMYLGMSQAEADDLQCRGTFEGGKLKEEGTTHWASPNYGATNESGFTALPGGDRSHFGVFYNVGNYAYFWSSTEYDSNTAWCRALGYLDSGVYRNFNHLKSYGHSVRCVRD
jgi:uncharacterized protein (TIGR02145 family)